MTQSSHIADIEAIHQLLTSYSFEAESYQTKAIVAGWLAEYGPVWVSHAITEALYQGRYKLISIDQILKLWQRRGQPIRHFNREFESIILGQTLLYPTGYGDGPEPSTLRRTAALTAPQPAPPASGSELPIAAPEQVGSTSQTTAPADQGTSSAPDEAREPMDEESEPVVVADVAAGEALPPVDDPAIHAAEGNRLGTSSADNAAADEPDGAVPDFRPLASDRSSRWQQIEVIQPFVPRRDESELHERLRAVVQGGMRE